MIKKMTHSLCSTIFLSMCTKQRAVTTPTREPAFCYEEAQWSSLIMSKPLCFCLTLSAGKLNFPSLETGLPNRIISPPIYYHLILKISVLELCFSQTNRQKRADMGSLIILSPADSSCGNGALPLFSHECLVHLICSKNNSLVTSL